jgi:diadenosine tetraphosphate (Ap4A) HIT family hydrolase
MRLDPGECLACDVIDGRVAAPGGVIYEDDAWHLDHSVSPCPLRGWLILKSKRHVEHVADLTQSEAESMGPLVRMASSAVMRALGAERVYALSMGEFVRHVHIYVLPRYPDMPTDGLQVLTTMFSAERPWACSEEEASDAAERVRSAICDRD